MIQKRKSMIIFAVIAVIIVAIPITLYEGQILYNFTPVNVNSGSSDASYSWIHSFTPPANYNYTYCCLAPVLNTTSIISDNGHLNSSFSFSLWTDSLFNRLLGPSVRYDFCLLISGNFTSNLHPSSISVTTNGTMPSKALNLSMWFGRANFPSPKYSKDWAKVTLTSSPLYNFEKNDTYGNVTFTGPSPSSWYLQDDPILNLTNDYALTNDTGLGKNTAYHFSFLTEVSYTIYHPILISPFYLYQPYTVHFMVSLKGLSKPVTNQITMTFEDIPA